MKIGGTSDAHQSRVNPKAEALRARTKTFALDVLELVDYRVGPGGEHFTCRNRGNGHVVAVSRQRRWTEEEERRYVDALDRALGGGDATDQVLPIERAIIEPDLVSPSDSQSKGLGQSPSFMELVAR